MNDQVGVGCLSKGQKIAGCVVGEVGLHPRPGTKPKTIIYLLASLCAASVFLC